MAAYLEFIAIFLEKFTQVHVKLIPRDLNSRADALALLTTSKGLTKMEEVTITRLLNLSTTYSLVATMDLDEQV